MRIGYKINIGGIILDSENDPTADLISLMTTNDSTQNDYTLDMIINNKDLKYNYRVIVGDMVTVVVSLLDGDIEVYKKAIFTGGIDTVNWDYTSMHIIAGGIEASYNLDSPATKRVYENVESFGDYLTIIKHLVEDYNKANPLIPIHGVFPVGSPGDVPKLDVYETDDTQNVETIMDDISHHLGMLYHTEIMDGKTYLMLLFGGASFSSESVKREIGQGLIFDSAACNEIGYVTEVIVHGVRNSASSDERNMQGTKTCWGKAEYKCNRRIVRNIRISDPNCHEESSCVKRAKAILEAGSTSKDSIKPVFTQCAPSIGSYVCYEDPLYKGVPIDGIVIRRELRISASEGWICTLELVQPKAGSLTITTDSGYE